jgi:hypothetical protein
MISGPPAKPAESKNRRLVMGYFTGEVDSTFSIGGTRNLLFAKKHAKSM